MTLPSSGPLTINDVNVETGRGSGTTTGIDWIRDNSKDNATGINQLYSRAWYQRNVDGNCNNDNCASGSNSGNIQCQNCTLDPLGNCVNCDTRSWLQSDCNCACTYNCTQNTNQTYNCNCDCACACFVCACACW
jgi:hypothetical protein